MGQGGKSGVRTRGYRRALGHIRRPPQLFSPGSGVGWRAAVVTLFFMAAAVSVGAPAAQAAFPGSDGVIVLASSGSAGRGGWGGWGDWGNWWNGFGHGSGGACTSGGDRSALYTLSPDAPQPAVLTCTPGTDSHPFVSPDGTEVVFTETQRGGPGQLYTYPLDQPGGAVAPTLASDPATASDDYASWSPAGDGTIIFQRTLPGQLPQLFTENVSDPSAATPVFSSPTGSSDTEPVFDPANPELIAFVRVVNGQSHIFTYDLSSQSLLDLSAQDGVSGADDSKPDFSPGSSGGGIVFQSDRACGDMQLYTMTVQGTDQEPVFRAFDNGTFDGPQVCRPPTRDPVFSPDGGALSFDQSYSEWGFSSSGPYEVSINSSGTADGHVRALTFLYGGFDFLGANGFDDPSWAPASGPPAETPEASLPVLLPPLGVAAAGTMLFLRRRRRQGVRA